MAPNIVVVVSVLLRLICFHIDWGMPYLCIFAEDVVSVIGAITDKLV